MTAVLSLLLALALAAVAVALARDTRRGPPRRPVTHLSPGKSGNWVTQCCGQDPFGLPLADSFTDDPGKRTCDHGGAA